MSEFRLHPLFEKELAALEKRRMRYFRESLSGFQRLCEVHFNPINPEMRINPGKLHRVMQFNDGAIWKTELAVIKSGLRPNQYPRIWFFVSGVKIVFLCVADHVNNYRDAETDKIAIKRAKDFY